MRIHQRSVIQASKRSSRIHSPGTLLALVVGIGCSFGASAQSYLSPKPEPTSREDRFRAEVSVLYGGYDTQIRFDQTVPGADPIPGTVISGEDDLGLPSSQVLITGELTLFPAQHHLVRFGVLSMRRDASTTLTRPISYDNEDFAAGTQLDSYFNLSLIGLTYGYMPWRTDRFEVAGTFGIQIGSVSARLQGRADPPREPDSATGPVPLFGLEGRYDFTKHWSVDARVSYLSLAWYEALGLSVDEAESTLIDGRLAVRWRYNPHVLYGLGYRYFKFDATSLKTDPSGDVSVGVTGPMLFVQVSL